MAEKSHRQEYLYKLLDRLKTDCDYYLGNGNHHPQALWAGNEQGQIAKMKEIWNQLEEKPEWLTWEQILDYGAKMGVDELPSSVDRSAEETIQTMLDKKNESRDWTEEELKAVSEYNKAHGQMSFEEFCKELELAKQGKSDKIKFIDHNKKTEDVNNKSKNEVKIYQISDIENCKYAFMSWDYAKDNINLEDYKEVATIELPEIDNMDEMDILEYVFMTGNSNPNYYKNNPKTRSISVSDIIELNGKKYYVDTVGFIDLTDKNLEESTKAELVKVLRDPDDKDQRVEINKLPNGKYQVLYYSDKNSFAGSASKFDDLDSAIKQAQKLRPTYVLEETEKIDLEQEKQNLEDTLKQAEEVQELQDKVDQKMDEILDENKEVKTESVYTDIKKAKEKLIRQATKKNGTWENFGQAEVRKLEDKYFDEKYSHNGIWEAIQNFDDWCGNFSLSDIKSLNETDEDIYNKLTKRDLAAEFKSLDNINQQKYMKCIPENNKGLSRIKIHELASKNDLDEEILYWLINIRLGDVQEYLKESVQTINNIPDSEFLHKINNYEDIININLAKELTQEQIKYIEQTLNMSINEIEQAYKLFAEIYLKDNLSQYKVLSFLEYLNYLQEELEIQRKGE